MNGTLSGSGLYTGGGGYVSITAPTVPEPSTWMMMMLGLGGLGAMGLPRKGKPKLA